MVSSLKRKGEIYSFFRILHWILSRIGFLQIVALLLWLGERSKYENQPPIPMWQVYVHVGIYFLSSTGLSVRILPRLSLWLTIASHLQFGYVYLNEIHLAYPSWLRARLAWRSLMPVAVYLRMLGVSGSNAPTRAPGVGGSDSLGLALLCVATGAVGVVSVPSSLVTVHEELQVLDANATWWAGRLEPVIGVLLASSLLLASLCYALSVLIVPASGGTSSYRLFPEWLTWLADRLTMVAFFGLSLLRDCNMKYWERLGVEFWLEIRVLVDNFILVAGILITEDLQRSKTFNPEATTVPVSKKNK